MIIYRVIEADEMALKLFDGFIRRQEVTRCLRKENGSWTVREIAFIDDWNEADYREMAGLLQQTAQDGGLVCGAFAEGKLKGFVSVERKPLGSGGQYLDLSQIYVSQELRRQGIGRELFAIARRYAEGKAEKLYISAHSAVESQAFYRAMGCVEAEEYQAEHVEKEPCDCQLECRL